MVTATRTHLLETLREDLGLRRIGSGMARLDAYWGQTGRLDPLDPDAASLLCYVAQWVDAGWREVDVVQDGLTRFSEGDAREAESGGLRSCADGRRRGVGQRRAYGKGSGKFSGWCFR